MSKQFERFESLVERVIEGSLSRIFSDQLQAREIVVRLVRAMEDGAEGNRAPDHYRVTMHAEDLASLPGTAESLVEHWARQITLMAQEAELELPCLPRVELTVDGNVPQGTVQVSATLTPSLDGQTESLDPAHLRRGTKSGPDEGTYLIIGGRRHVPLTRPVVTIGRRLDCDVVLSHSTVSRRHAQLRWRFGRFVLYDLGSSAGTYVNGHRVSEVVLEPGDVLTLGQVDIIYGRDSQGDTGPQDGGTTRGFGGSLVSKKLT